jgi:hypothetical protein
MRIAPRTFSSNLGSVYLYVFPDPTQRQRIETYSITSDWGRNYFSARQISGEILRTQIVRQTILEVLDKIRKFKETDPNAKGLGI